jgi:hypothetical protein
VAFTRKQTGDQIGSWQIREGIDWLALADNQHPKGADPMGNNRGRGSTGDAGTSHGARRPGLERTRIAAAVFAIAACAAGAAQAFEIAAGPDWKVNLDNSVMYTAGWRAQPIDRYVANHPFFHQGETRFDKGDMVTNRLQDLLEFQAVYKDRAGFRVTGSAWKDWAYKDKVPGNPALLAMGLNDYPNGISDYTKRFHYRGGELLDAFVFDSAKFGDITVHGKAGRLTQFWGNAFYFGFSNIAYGQAGVDNIKGFSQPGSELKELFLPRKQVLLSADISPELSVAAQYFFEFGPNRYPEGATYFSAGDFIYKGPTSVPALASYAGGPVTAGTENAPRDNDHNFGVKVAWSPKWAEGDLGFYYRVLDDPHPWALFDINSSGTGGNVHLDYARKVKLFGASYERTFGSVSTGVEISYRKNTGLNSALGTFQPGVPAHGATGDIVNVIANAFIQLGSTPLYDTGLFIAELSHTQLRKVTGNASMYNGVGYAGCGGGDKWSGCSTRNATALWVNFEPQWLQVFPGVDLSMPSSYAMGVKGLPAYAAGAFYAQGTGIFNVGIKALFDGKSSITLSYNGLNWRPGAVVDGPVGPMYGTGTGAHSLRNRDWISLTLKTSF